MRPPTVDRVYSNAGNPAILALVESGATTVLDVGCGAGDNARVLMSRRPDMSIYGITHSQPEAEAPALKVEQVSVTGAMPLWLLRRYLLPVLASSALDSLACRIWPNLFGSQVLIKAVKQ